MTNKIIASRLKLALDQNNMKAIELAEKLNVSRSTISQYLSGISKPKPDRAKEIASILDVDPLWILGLDVPQKSHTSPIDIFIQSKKIEDFLKFNPEYIPVFEKVMEIKRDNINLVIQLLERF